MNSTDFKGSEAQRAKFIKWVENMDEEEFNDRYHSEQNEGGFTDAQKAFAGQIRLEEKLEGPQTPEAEIQGPHKPESRQSIIKRLRSSFEFQN